MRINRLQCFSWVKLALSFGVGFSLLSSIFFDQAQQVVSAASPLHATPSLKRQQQPSPPRMVSELDDEDKPPGKLTDAEKATLEKTIATSLAEASQLEPLALLKEPKTYMNKKVAFTGVFNGFSGLGLDYKKAFRDSRDYVAFSILRPDVTANTIPLSELKLFFPRKKSAEVTDLESGDTVQVIGTVFSAALEEPWITVDYIKVLQKNKTQKVSSEKAH
jgi:hypothetical protein